MRATPRIVVAVGSGYLLGRTKKLKVAVILGGAVTGRHIPTSAGDLLRLGARLVDTSPELSRLKDAVRGRLLVAGRDAAVASATYQLETLTTRLTVHLEQLEGRAGPVVEIEARDPQSHDPEAPAATATTREGARPGRSGGAAVPPSRHPPDPGRARAATPH